jgi:hypothetical protein
MSLSRDTPDTRRPSPFHARTPVRARLLSVYLAKSPSGTLTHLGVGSWPSRINQQRRLADNPTR